MCISTFERQMHYTCCKKIRLVLILHWLLYVLHQVNSSVWFCKGYSVWRSCAVRNEGERKDWGVAPFRHQMGSFATSSTFFCCPQYLKELSQWGRGRVFIVISANDVNNNNSFFWQILYYIRHQAKVTNNDSISGFSVASLIIKESCRAIFGLVSSLLF